MKPILPQEGYEHALDVAGVSEAILWPVTTSMRYQLGEQLVLTRVGDLRSSPAFHQM